MLVVSSYLGISFTLILSRRVLVLGVGAFRRHRLLDGREEVGEPGRDRRTSLGRLLLRVGRVLGLDRVARLGAGGLGGNRRGVVFGALGIASGKQDKVTLLSLRGNGVMYCALACCAGFDSRRRQKQSAIFRWFFSLSV